MPTASILLRMLLCLALAMTGWAEALAAGALDPAQQQAAQTATPPCHGGTDADDGGAQQADPAQPAAVGDCCSGACDCACAHAPVAVTLASPPVGGVAHLRYPSARQPGIAAPLLPHLIRPPIG